MTKYVSFCAAFLVSLVLAGCGGGSNNSSPPKLALTVPVPNVVAGTNFGFDISAVDSSMHRYYFTDRNNKAVDVYDTVTHKLIKQITGGFFGVTPGDNSRSGPDGINLITGTTFIYVGDVNSVKVIDTKTDTVVNNIVVSASGLRADEGCYDPDHQIYMISSPEETPPFATFINTNTQTIMSKLIFADSAGLEACAYDHASQSFFVNNDGTTLNPNGELDVIKAASVVQGAPAVTAAYPEGNCDPTGLILGPGNDLAVSCRQGTAGAPLTVLIFDRTNGHLLTTINAGGGDQIDYDSVSNRYYVAASRWTSSGLSAGPAGCTSASPCTPVLGIIDAATRSLVTQIPSGNNAHSVAVDGVTHQAFMPFSSATSPAGCSTCAGGFNDGGVAIFQIQ